MHQIDARSINDMKTNQNCKSKIQNKIENENQTKTKTTTKFLGRKYFFYSVCNFCRNQLTSIRPVCCQLCKMTYYCTVEHMRDDCEHNEICTALRSTAEKRGGQLYQGIRYLSSEQLRTYRVITLQACQNIITARQLQPFEQELILFPRLCNSNGCRENQYDLLENCSYCGEVAFCEGRPEHLGKSHQVWCSMFSQLKRINLQQEIVGSINPVFPMKCLKLTDFNSNLSTTNAVLNKLNAKYSSAHEYVSLTQAATGPLSAWYTFYLTGNQNQTEIVIHLIGAEPEFEVKSLNKWESFCMHLMPSLIKLKIVFIGPELGENNDHRKIKLVDNFLGKNGSIIFGKFHRLCQCCNKQKKSFECYFETLLYHEYCENSNYQKPNLICFFNPGLHRNTGFNVMDTWPSTIQKSANNYCPILITSYTQYESPLDLKRFISYSTRKVNIIMPPTVNPFSSKKPERNFISDEMTPIIFKNFYFFIVA